MQPIIKKNNRVAYGVYDEPIDFNYKDFVLNNFFGRQVSQWKKRFAFHAFNYLCVNTDRFLVGMAAVRLGYLHTVFAYVYDYEKGLIFEYDTKGPGKGALHFPGNPDEYEIAFTRGKNHLSIIKSHAEKKLHVNVRLGGRMEMSIRADYGIDSHEPLRVLNPSTPNRWTFTEKCAPIRPSEFSLLIDDQPMPYKPQSATMLYDWSGGYLRRETNWYWAAFSGTDLSKKTDFGANFAALTNETYFSENAFWINNNRNRVHRVIFDFDHQRPYEPWHIWDEDKTVDLVFIPEKERSEKVNAFFVKTFFRQFFGRFTGTLIDKNNTSVEFTDKYGICEFHRALW